MRINNRDRLFLFTYFVTVILLGKLPSLDSRGLEGTAEARLHRRAVYRHLRCLRDRPDRCRHRAVLGVRQAVIMLLLIQFGGLGIITFLTIFLANPRRKISFASRKLIGDYYVASVESNPRKIARSVMHLHLAIELAGALACSCVFRSTVGRHAPDCQALFHAVSAFCNAGFSTFSTNLEAHVTEPHREHHDHAAHRAGRHWVRGHGGSSSERVTGRRSRLSLHTRLVLAMSACLIAGRDCRVPPVRVVTVRTPLSVPAQKVMAARSSR